MHESSSSAAAIWEWGCCIIWPRPVGRTVCLIEKGELTSGSTWHAAGQCPSFIANYNMALIHHHSNELYPKLEELTGQHTGWHGCGGIRLALTQEELDYFRLVQGTAANIGFRMEIIGPDEIKKLNPFIEKTDDIIAGAWTLDDGYVDPASCCQAMAIGARNMGATVVKNTRVTGLNLLPSGEWEVLTEKGNVICEHVVNAAGCYAGAVGAWAGVDVPITNIRHQYLVTEPIQAFIDRDVEIPVMRDPRASAYYRQEQDAGLIGIYERSDTRNAWGPEGQAWESENELFEAEYDPIMPWLERVMERMPIFAEAGVMKVVNGAISHTPDDNPLIGPAGGVRNYWLSTGASIGIAQGAGAGKYLAQWIMEGAAEINTIGIDPRRFGPYADEMYTHEKTHEAYWNMYDLLLPGQERPAGRNARTTPLHDKLKAKGCVHTEAFGWERPKWFSLDGREEACGFRRNNVFEVVEEECRAVRERVGVLDLSSFAKYDVKGPDAEAFLNRLCANKVSTRPGGVVLSHVLTDLARIQNEFTITRLADDHFYLLSGATSQVRDLDLLNFGKLDSEDVTITDITDEWGTLVVTGPRSRDLLAKITDTDLSNENFRWLTGQEIEVAGVSLRALRVSYAGELGWELHTPMEHLVAVYDAVWAAGEEFGIADFGVYAVNSLRMEKAYRGFGAEITNEISPIEADLMRFVKLDKEFVGREALLAHQEKGEYSLMIAYVEVDVKDADVAGGEPVWSGDEVIGLTTSGGYGYSVGKSLAFVYVKPEYIAPGSTFDIEILAERCKATVLAEPAYDPKNERMRV